MPFSPFQVRGRIVDAVSTTVGRSNMRVHLINNTTKERTGEVFTDSSGYFVLDCANFPNGYSNNDSISVMYSSDLYSRHVITAIDPSILKDYRFTIDITIENVSLGRSLITDAGLNL